MKRINITIPKDVHEDIVEYCQTKNMTCSGLLTKWARMILGKSLVIKGLVTKREKNLKAQLFEIATDGYTKEGLLKGLFLIGEEDIKDKLRKTFPEIDF